MATVNKPFPWYGGKARMVKHLLELVPPHRVYIEPYCGSAALLFAKPPAEVEIINDIDPGVAAVFRCLADAASRRAFMRLARQTEHGRRLFAVCREEWARAETLHARAWMYWYVAVISFSGYWGSACATNVAATTCGRPLRLSALRKTVRTLPSVGRRLHGVVVSNCDALEVIPRYATDDSFVYVDPPYIGPLRRCAGGYRYDCDIDHHVRLVELLLETPGAVILSCYDHPVYDSLRRAGWQQRTWQRTCDAAARTRWTGLQGPGSAVASQTRQEMILLNPECRRRLLLAVT